jgi:D-glycero-D-manno-heptose 1,7-bisphosphate phosphatase
MSALKSAVFLDRDGVVIEDSHYVGDPSRIKLLPGAEETIAALNRAGWKVVIVTNQSGVARGLFSFDSVGAVHDRITMLLRPIQARIDAYFFCPHHPDADVLEFRAECDCRKPKPGLLRRAAKELGLDLAKSWMIGDRLTDLEAGAAAGCRTVLVRTGLGNSIELDGLDRIALKLELVADDLAGAVAKLGLIADNSGLPRS